MASAMAAVTLTMATPSLAGKKPFLGSNALLTNPRTGASASTPRPYHHHLEVRALSASMKEKAIAGLSAAALAAALVIPDVAEAAQPGISPSLKNFLLSIVAGGVVLSAIGGAVIAVANFDPVKRS